MNCKLYKLSYILSVRKIYTNMKMKNKFENEMILKNQ